MGTCERCGADAVDGRGVCRNCGWQSPHAYDTGAPSYGETRAADPAVSPPPTNRYPANAMEADRAATVAAQATRSGPSGGNPATSRYCGVCGARIQGSETFCGQCGSPVAPASGAGRYQVGSNAGWNDDDRNSYTEALPEAPGLAASRNPYVANDQYARSYPPQYGSRGGASEPAPTGMTRSTRMTLGIILLALSVFLALGAIALLFVGL